MEGDDTEIKSILLSGGMSAIAKLLDKEPLDTIIDTLPEPIDFFLSLVKVYSSGGYEFDADTLFNSLREQAEKEGLELIELLKKPRYLLYPKFHLY